MSAENDLALAYHMGYDDALAKRKPDASKAQVLAPYHLATENAKLRERIHELEIEGSDHFYRTAYAEDANRTLEAENAKLQEQIDAAHMSRLLTENENESLLELCVDVWHLFTEHGAVHPCDLPVVDDVRDRMREMGIEGV
jgi:hypothetical protein